MKETGMTISRRRLHVPVMLLAGMLAACGGGSSSSDDDGNSSVPANRAPTANAGADRAVNESSAVTLNGSGLDPEDGSNLDYAWTQTSGPAAAAVSGADTPNLGFTAPAVTQQQVLVFELRVTDGDGLSDTDAVAVTVNDLGGGGGNTAPSASAGPDQAAAAGATVTLDGSASSDAEDGTALTYAWTQDDGPAVTLNNAGGAIASFSALEVGATTLLTFRLTVTDGAGAMATDTSVVTVLPPASATGFLESACLDNGAPAEFCAALGMLQSEVPDRIVLASLPTPRGALITQAQPARAPSAKTVDGDPSDWIGAPTRLGGTARLDAGEYIYSDYLFDAWGADDGGDAQRLALLDPLAEVEPRTFRFDQLFQAAGDQFGAPQPVGTPDHYGDATGLGDEADLYDLRWAADADTVFLLARFSALTDAARPGLIVMLDTRDGPAAPAAVGFGTGLSTGVFDTALLLTEDGIQQRDLASGTVTPLAGQVAVNAAGWSNALEAGLPAALFAASTRVAVVAGARSAEGITPANAAYRFNEPVAGIYNDKSQALSLLDGNVDAFAATLTLAALRGGVSESFRPGPGYFERQFASRDNISREGGEDGLQQPYGLYVPQSYAPGTPSRMTLWLHYRGGKAHSGAAWTPRLITQLGEEQDNVVVTPRGRGTSTWYTTQAHQDVFEVLADVAGSALVGDRLPGLGPVAGLLDIDPAHVALSGYSMGGYGTYLFGLLYPDLFSAGYSTSGAVTQGLWTGIGPDDPLCETEQQDIPEVGEANFCFGEANDSNADAQLNFRILENARHFPIVIHHGTNDELVPVSGVQRMGLRMAELGYRYDLAMFLGYEHYTQAIVDEWADGAAYLNAFARPENPRQVTYKLVPALLRALNTIQARDKGPFAFSPDGAWWVDEMTVRDPDPDDVAQFGMIDAESFALDGTRTLPAPRTGDVAPPRVSTPVFSLTGHSTPYVRHGLDWVELGALPTRNAFRASFTQLSSATLDVQRMNLDLAQVVEGTAVSDGDATLTLSGVVQPVRVFVNGIEHVDAQQGDRVTVPIHPGVNLVLLVPPGLAVPPSAGAATPDLAAACRALGLAATPLCAAIDTASTQLVGGCAAFASAAFCSTFGGNLHGLIDGCREQAGAQGEPICKLVEQFMFGAASLCRQLAGVPPEFCALLSGELISDSEVQAYENGWTANALALQRRLGEPLPLRDADFPATHNSFNWTNANFPQTLSGSDSNQKYSLVDQFRLGIRGIELDVHWWYSTDGTPETQFRAPVLCHGNALHAGCSTERPLRTGLAEIRVWLLEHPEEVIVIDLEDHLAEPGDDSLLAHDTAAAVLQAELGDLLYVPADAGRSCADGFPVDLSRSDVLAAGKQVVIYTGCGAGSAWPALVWARRLHSQESMNGLGAGIIHYPDACVFTADQFRDHWTRMYEDSTLVCEANPPPGACRLSTADEVREMVRCGINMPSLDQIAPSDPRLAAFVWSWEPGQPDTGDSHNCAAHTADGRFTAEACSVVLPQACVRATDRSDWVLGTAAAWGAGACPPGYGFGVPRSGNENEFLKAAKVPGTRAWLNYTDDGNGEWTAGS
jgi:hypothetical protein